MKGGVVRTAAQLVGLVKEALLNPNRFVPVSYVDKIYLIHERTDDFNHLAFYRKDENGEYKLLGRYENLTTKELAQELAQFMPDD